MQSTHEVYTKQWLHNVFSFVTFVFGTRSKTQEDRKTVDYVPTFVGLNGRGFATRTVCEHDVSLYDSLYAISI